MGKFLISNIGNEKSQPTCQLTNSGLIIQRPDISPAILNAKQHQLV